MTRTVLFVMGLWFWLFRRKLSRKYLDTSRSLHNAWMHLYRDYNSRASTLTRGKLLPEHEEALNTLHNHAVMMLHTSGRFWKLEDCYQYVKEELICL